MANLNYKTRGNSSPQGKPRVYFCCHFEDFNKYFQSVSDEILAKQNCAIWYSDEEIVRDEDFFAALKQMQLFVMPVTTNLLCTENEALDFEIKFAIENHIPVLPLMQESGLEELFNKKCGDLQFLDKNNTDITAISYDEKLKKYLESVLIGDELAEKIRAAFDAYVFLSYRKKDRKYAQELMRLIHKNEFCRDIAIWYDEFLTPGENFNDSIKEALQKSGLFVLTVTPNLVNEQNYIMTTEYPMAKQQGKPILPAELVPTDREQLNEKYEDIPNPTDAHNEVELSNALLESIKRMAIKENDNSPEHNFFIGLAYLGGVDVEVDYERAVALITNAAEKGCDSAMRKLIDMYTTGDGVKRDPRKAAYWKSKINKKLLEELISDADEIKKRKSEIYRLGKSERVLSRETLEVAYQMDKALKFFTGSVEVKVQDFCNEQLKLSDLYFQCGDIPFAEETINDTIVFVSENFPDYINKISGRGIIQDSPVDTAFLGLYLKLVEFALAERKYNLARDIIKRAMEWLQTFEGVTDGTTEINLQFLQFKLMLQEAQIIYSLEEYETANQLLKELENSIVTFVDSPSISSENIDADFDPIDGIMHIRSQEVTKIVHLFSMQGELYPFMTECMLLHGEVEKQLGSNMDAIDSFQDALKANSLATRKRVDTEIICHLQLALLFAQLNAEERSKEHIEKANELLETSDNGSVQIAQLKRRFFTVCGDISVLMGNDDASCHYKEAIKIARTILQDAPLAENVLYLVDLCGKMYEITKDNTKNEKIIDLMYELADLIVLNDKHLATRESLGEVYFIISKYDNNLDTVKKAYDIFEKLAFDYPECKCFISKQSQLKSRLQ